MSDWATYQQVKDRALGVADDFSQDEILQQVEDARDLILSEVPSVESRIQSGDLTLDRLSRITCNVVIRKLKNPEGLRTVQDSTGPFGGSTTYAGDDPGELYLTESERRSLAGRVESQRRAFSAPPRLY